MKQIQSLLFAALFLALFSSALADGIDPGNPMLVKSIRAELWIHGIGTITGPISPEDNLTLKLLVPQSSPNQVVESITETLNYGGQGFIPTSHETDKFGNSYALFSFNNLNGREFEYDINAVILTKTYAGLSDYNISSGFAPEMQQFLAPTQHAESNDATIRTIASSIKPSDSELESIASVAEWVNNYIEYDLSYWGRSQSARQVLDSRKGVCEEYSNLTTALLRARGIPARIVSGLVYSSKDWNNHAWVEAYVPGSGWVGVDSTYGEAGLLDGTHIEMGKTDDRSNASDQGYSYIGNFEVGIIDQRKVNVLSVEKFENIGEIIPINFPDTNIMAESFGGKLNSGQKFDLNAVLENKTGMKTILPAQFKLHSAFITGKKDNELKKLVLLKPFEKRDIFWQAVAPDANANYAYGYSIETMGAEFQGVIPVMNSRETGGAQENGIIVKELVPTITQDEGLELKLGLLNSGNEEIDLNITVYGADSAELISKIEKVLPLESREFKYNIPKIFSQEFVLLKLASKGLDYQTKININRGIESAGMGQGQIGQANQGNSEKAAETVRQAEKKAGEGFSYLLQNNLLVPLGGIVLLVLVLFGLITAFGPKRR